jgi:long-chain acyl-CoA synthetase
LPDGRNVYPEDIERVLNQHPLVRESCVVGVERERGEQVHAVLLTDRPDRTGEIVRDANRQLAPQQLIRSHSLWTEADFPRTATLKVNRKLVRETVARQATTVPPERPAGPGPAADAVAALVARVAEHPPGEMREQAELEADLGLDSLARVELLGAVEEELGRVVDETRLGPQTTLDELRRLVAEGSPGGPGVEPARWPRASWARAVRPLLQWVVFRVQDYWMEFELVHPQRTERLPLPSIMIYNYHGPYAALAVLRALPRRLRVRTACGKGATAGKAGWGHSPLGLSRSPRAAALCGRASRRPGAGWMMATPSSSAPRVSLSWKASCCHSWAGRGSSRSRCRSRLCPSDSKATSTCFPAIPSSRTCRSGAVA